MAKEWEARTIDHGYSVLVSEIMLQQTQYPLLPPLSPSFFEL